MDLGLNGRIAIVVAASKGLGLAVATELSREGAEVAICARNADRLQSATGAIRSATGRTAYFEAFDVTDQARVGQFVAAVEKQFGRVDICVTNAGGPPAKPFMDVTIEQWRTAVDTTLMSAVYFAREVLPRMQKNNWGRLLTITSNSVKQPLDNMVLSNSIRAAVTGMARTLANEFGHYGITVNNICPGYTKTDRLGELADTRAASSGETRDQVFARMAAMNPTGRLGTPEEFAAAVAFLVSERASFINGVSLTVDGGMVRSIM